MKCNYTKRQLMNKRSDRMPYESYERSDILLVEDVMALLYVGRNTAYNLLNSGELKGFRIGRSWRIPKEAVNEYIMRKCKLE